jgi:glutamyl-tRNA reductase
MQLCITGISYKTAAIEIREKLSFQENDLDEAYRLLLARDGIRECVILSTCNRVEIYAILEEDSIDFFKSFMGMYHNYLCDLESKIYCKKGTEALRHICAVASGLDSMVLGEPQIFGQLKDAYAQALKRGAVKYTLAHLFSQIFSIVKKVRNKTAIGEKNVSISYAAVKLAQRIFHDIRGKKVMILGAGEMGKLTVRNLIDAGISEVMVANRTFNKAVEIAQRFGGTAIMLHEIIEYLSKTDILISSVSSFILSEKMIRDTYSFGKSGPLLMIDIAVPRSIEPRISSLENVFLYNIDDLKSVVEFNSHTRQREAQAAISLIEKKIPSLQAYMNTADLIPTLISIRCKAEEIRKSSVEQIINKLSISDKQRGVIEDMTKEIVKKVLNHSEVKFKEYSVASKTIKSL